MKTSFLDAVDTLRKDGFIIEASAWKTARGRLYTISNHDPSFPIMYMLPAAVCSLATVEEELANDSARRQSGHDQP